MRRLTLRKLVTVPLPRLSHITLFADASGTLKKMDENGDVTAVGNGGSLPASVIAETASVPTGTGAYWLAVTPDGTRLCVANNTAGTLTILDAQTGAVVYTVTVGAGPSWVAVTPDSKTALVTNSGDDTVSIVDIATGTVTFTVTLTHPGHPDALPYFVTVTADGAMALTINHDGFATSFIDIATGVETAIFEYDAVPQAGGLTQLVLTPDGATAVVPRAHTNRCDLLDLATKAVTGSIEIGDQPGIIVTSPDGTLAATVNQGDDTVTIIDLAALTSDTVTVDAGTAELLAPGFTPDNATLMVGNYATGIVSFIDVATLTVVRTVSLGASAFPYTPTATLDSKTALVACYGSAQVAVIDIATGEFALIDGFGYPLAVYLAPNGAKGFLLDLDDSIRTLERLVQL